jgi:hypothetical protein
MEVLWCFLKDVKKTKHEVVRYVDWKVCSRADPTYMCEKQTHVRRADMAGTCKRLARYNVSRIHGCQFNDDHM